MGNLGWHALGLTLLLEGTDRQAAGVGLHAAAAAARAGGSGAPRARQQSVEAYRPRDPRRGVLHPRVERLWPRLVEATEAESGTIPGFVKRVVGRDLECNFPEAGFIRLQCPDFPTERALVFSCDPQDAGSVARAQDGQSGGGGLCPSRGARRMHDTVEHALARRVRRAPSPASAGSKRPMGSVHPAAACPADRARSLRKRARAPRERFNARVHRLLSLLLIVAASSARPAHGAGPSSEAPCVQPLALTPALVASALEPEARRLALSEKGPAVLLGRRP